MYYYYVHTYSHLHIKFHHGFNLPNNGSFTVFTGVNVPVPCRAFMSRCAHSHVRLVRVCGYIAIVLWPPRPTGGVTGIPAMYNTHSQTCYVARRSCHGQTRALYWGSPCGPRVKWWCAHSHLIDSREGLWELWLPAMTNGAYRITLWPSWATKQVLLTTHTLHI